MDHETEAKILVYRNQGLSYRSIASMVGYSVASVHKILKRHKKLQSVNPIFDHPLDRSQGCIICHAYLSGWDPYPICKDPKCCQIWVEARMDASYSPSDKAFFGLVAAAISLSVVHKEPNGDLYLFPDSKSHILYHAGRGRPLAIRKVKDGTDEKMMEVFGQ